MKSIKKMRIGVREKEHCIIHHLKPSLICFESGYRYFSYEDNLKVLDQPLQNHKPIILLGLPSKL